MKVLAIASLASVAVAQSSLTEYSKGGCKDVVFIFARGSTEPGNVGFIIGPPLFKELRKLVPSLAIEGVPYAAGLGTNMLPGGADPKGVEAATKLFTQAHAKCPNSALVGGGYSQGAAVMHRTIEKLPKDVQAHIAGVVTYGDTRNKQDKGQIPNFPKDKVKVFCNTNDGVCGGMLNVNGGHMSYNKDFAPGAKYLAAQVQKWKSSKGGASDAPASDDPPAAEAEEAPAAPAPKAAKGKGKTAGKSAPKGKAAAAPKEMAGHSHGRRFVQW